MPTAYERAPATPGGDTAIAKPTRAVPQRVPRERRESVALPLLPNRKVQPV